MEEQVDSARSKVHATLYIPSTLVIDPVLPALRTELRPFDFNNL